MKKSRSSVKPVSIWAHPLLPFVIGLLAITFVVFGNSVNNGYAYDDKPFIERNYIVQQGFSGIPELLTTNFWAGYTNVSSANPSYRPLPLITLSIEYQLFGLRPGVNHFFNLVYYGLTVGILFLLLNIFLRQKQVWLSFAIAALFCVHPIHAEVVANVKGRDDLLALLNGLLSLYLIFRYQANQKLTYLVSSVVFFFLALISKGHMLAFLAVIPLSLYYFSAAPSKKLVQWTIPYLGAAVLFLMMQYNIIGKVAKLQTDFIDNPILAATSWSDGLATRIEVMGLYLKKLILPYPLSCDYSFAAIAPTTWSNPFVYVVILVYGALIYLAVRGMRAKKLWSFAIWLYLITILPISNLLIDYVVAFAERSMYTPSLGWIIFWVVGMGLGLDALERKGTLPSGTIKSFGKVGMTSLLVVFGFISVMRNPVWKDDLTLFSTDLKTHPESVRLNLLYAQELINKYPEQINGPLNPDLQKAKEALDAVQKISPDIPKCLLLQGHIAKMTGDNAQAEAYYQKTLALDENNPSVYFNLGVMADIRQDYNTAKSMYLKSLELFPNYTSALSNLGIIYGREGNYDAAIEQIEKSVKLDPSNKTNYNNLAMAYQFKGDKVKADYYRQQALEIGKDR